MTTGADAWRAAHGMEPLRGPVDPRLGHSPGGGVLDEARPFAPYLPALWRVVVSVVDPPDSTTFVGIDLSEGAKAAVRASFNPSQRADVLQVKALAGALVTLMERVRDDPVSSWDARRDAAIAIDAVREASMWSVAACTADVG